MTLRPHPPDAIPSESLQRRRSVRFDLRVTAISEMYHRNRTGCGDIIVTMEQMEQITMYHGVFCGRCGEFIEIGQCQTHPGLDVTLGPTADVTLRPAYPCKACGHIQNYGTSDVAHSTWPDGKEAHYPYKR